MTGPNLLAAPATAERLRALRDAGVLTEPAFRRGLTLALGSPGADRWRRFFSRTALGLGGALVVAGVIYFVAYNWHALPRGVKLGLLEAAVAACALGALRLRGLPRQLALTFAAALVGPLLATYGQVYQTGADAWTLFALWTALAIPFALSARFVPLWVGVGGLLNVTLHLGWWQVQPLPHGEMFSQLLLLSFALNGALWVGAELAAARCWWARTRWPARLFAAVSLLSPLPLAIAWMVKEGFFRLPVEGPLALGALLLAVPLTLWFYRRKRLDLFPLCLCALVGISLATTLAGRTLDELVSSFETTGLLLSALLVAEVAAAVVWLKRVRAERPAME